MNKNIFCWVLAIANVGLLIYSARRPKHDFYVLPCVLLIMEVVAVMAFLDGAFIAGALMGALGACMAWPWWKDEGTQLRWAKLRVSR